MFSKSLHSIWSVKKLSYALVCALPLVLAGCGGGDKDTSYPGETTAEEEGGGLFSGGFSLFGGDNAQAPATGSIGVNGYLWRATLDAISFLPLQSADPFGGVIISDWYADPATPDERVKVTVYILDKRLRADGLRVSVFRQTRSGSAWADAPASEDTARKLENAILTRAREMRIAAVDAGQ
ncbi:MAG: DUF3576 domain-containing protein [Parvibaculales bacterium]